jgi:hypothetical protein
MNLLDLIKLTPLMELTHGKPEVVVELIDGAVAMKHPELVGINIREFAGKLSGQCVLVVLAVSMEHLWPVFCVAIAISHTEFSHESVNALPYGDLHHYCSNRANFLQQPIEGWNYCE